MALTNNIKKLNGYVDLKDGSGTADKKTSVSVFDEQVNRSNAAYDTLAKEYKTSLAGYQKTIADQQKRIDELLQNGYGQAGTYLDNAYRSNTGALLKNYQLQSKNNDDQYSRNVGELQASRDRQLQSSNATLELLSKYLPTMGREGGLDYTGAASGALLRMQNANRSEVGSINANYDANKVSLDNAYGERRTSLDTNYNTTKAGYDTAYNQGKADLTRYLTDAQASNAQHYGDMSANAGYETGNKLADAGLDKYLSEATIRETERTEEREDAQLKEAYEREDTNTLETYLTAPDGYINQRISNIINRTDEKISQADYDTLYNYVMQYYDKLSENGKMAVDNLLSDAKAMIRTPEAQEAMDKVNAKQEADALKVAQDAARLADPTQVQFQFHVNGGDEVGNLSDVKCEGDSATNAGYGDNYTITAGGNKYWVEKGNDAPDELGQIITDEFKNVNGSDPAQGSIIIYQGKIYAYLSSNHGDYKWNVVQKRGNDSAFDKLCDYLGINKYENEEKSDTVSAGYTDNSGQSVRSIHGINFAVNP